ncbi:hypothetical protein BC938DRAFT_481713 [Jimgerdemannia flammicorona]|uniref:Uncharacterized protein n=1 Tax=Jimgerdemannia flammicorona TaxID=994334 RepID=A0A433QFI8_9FUNG|nr:hypothetical protein BC938DRAFT_481713 [Jimgerdemannia flammicorona]
MTDDRATISPHKSDAEGVAENTKPAAAVPGRDEAAQPAPADTNLTNLTEPQVPPAITDPRTLAERDDIATLENKLRGLQDEYHQIKSALSARSQLDDAADNLVDEHIRRLHEYNEIKDVGQMLLGKGTTIKKMYERFGAAWDVMARYTEMASRDDGHIEEWKRAVAIGKTHDDGSTSLTRKLVVLNELDERVHDGLHGCEVLVVHQTVEERVDLAWGVDDAGVFIHASREPDDGVLARDIDRREAGKVEFNDEIDPRIGVEPGHGGHVDDGTTAAFFKVEEAELGA